MPSAEAESIGTSSVLAAWNAATYVAQIDEVRLAQAMAAGTYLDATREIMEKYDEIYWNDESFVIERPSRGIVRFPASGQVHVYLVWSTVHLTEGLWQLFGSSSLG